MRRYVVTMDFYMYAEDDKQVIKNAKKYAEEIKDDNGSSTSIVSIHEQPYASTETRELKI